VALRLYAANSCSLPRVPGGRCISYAVGRKP
jgi:hypothetical protein